MTVEDKAVANSDHNGDDRGVNKDIPVQHLQRLWQGFGKKYVLGLFCFSLGLIAPVSQYEAIQSSIKCDNVKVIGASLPRPRGIRSCYIDTKVES